MNIYLSGSGTVLGQNFDDVGAAGNYAQAASSPTGGVPIFSNIFTPSPSLVVPQLSLMAISPDGTLIAASPTASTTSPGTNLLQNGNFITALAGTPAGWLDNGRLVVNDSVPDFQGQTSRYTGCTIYSPSGSPTGGACALSPQVAEFQPVSSDLIFVPAVNQILSVSTGALNWSSGDPSTAGGALAGSHIVFMSGTKLIAQSY